jgi:hypothetical protein
MFRNRQLAVEEAGVVVEHQHFRQFLRLQRLDRERLPSRLV